jgi:phytoene dehydrogenase-like protein
MASSHHAIVAGGGHNGLVAGAYLARAGARTVVLEARSKTGGAVDTSAPFPNHPEIKVSTYSYVISLMPAFIIEELGLADHGYRVTPFGPYYQAFPDGRSITIYGDDPVKTHESVARFSKEDADSLPEYEAWLHGVTEVIGPLLHQAPPNVGSTTLGDLLAQSKAAWATRRLGARGVADPPLAMRTTGRPSEVSTTNRRLPTRGAGSTACPVGRRTAPCARTSDADRPSAAASPGRSRCGRTSSAPEPIHLRA